MTATRSQCTLTTASEPPCESYTRVTITDSEGTTARGCPRHAVAALNGIIGARVDWEDSKGLNEWERTALELSEERNKLATMTLPLSGLVAFCDLIPLRRGHRGAMGRLIPE